MDFGSSFLLIQTNSSLISCSNSRFLFSRINSVAHSIVAILSASGLKTMKNPNASSTITRFEDSDEELESSSSSEPEDEKKSEIERELADVTFGELQKARSDGTHIVDRKFNKEKKSGRANKNRPMEASSKKPVGRFREIVQVPKKVVRDPRFESLSGTLDVDGFKRRYNFLFEENLPTEKEKLKKQLKKTKDPNASEELKNQISWINKQLKSEPLKKVDAAILAEHKKKEREAAKQGKKPYYLKKSEIKKVKLTEKYNELKATGKLEAFIDKKRKKNAAKDQRYMPYRRPNEDRN